MSGAGNAGAAWRRGAGVALLAALAACARGGALPAGMAVLRPFAYEAQAGGPAAAYGTLWNGSDSADVVDSVTTEGLGAAGLHSSETVNGFVTMRALERPAIAAHDSLALAPGGAHLMIESVPRELRAGDTLALTFWFHRAGPVRAPAPVRPYGQ